MTTVQIEVVTAGSGPPLALVAEGQWLGETRTVPMKDDGSQPGDIAGDGVYVAHMTGDTLRFLPLRILDLAGGKRMEVASEVAALEQPGGMLVYELTATGAVLHAQRTAAPWLGQPRVSHERERIDIAGAWMVLAFLVVAFLAGRSGRR